MRVHAGVRVHSLYLQEHVGVSVCPDEAPMKLLLGATHVHEQVLGLRSMRCHKCVLAHLLARFRVSPTSFFQVNTRAAEQLYGLVRDWSQQTGCTTLLDVCCGTGTIGLLSASKFEKVCAIQARASK